MMVASPPSLNLVAVAGVARFFVVFERPPRWLEPTTRPTL